MVRHPSRPAGWGVVMGGCVVERRDRRNVRTFGASWTEWPVDPGVPEPSICVPDRCTDDDVLDADLRGDCTHARGARVARLVTSCPCGSDPDGSQNRGRRAAWISNERFPLPERLAFSSVPIVEFPRTEDMHAAPLRRKPWGRSVATPVSAC